MTMTGILRRGALIVLEGCDRCGKTTQSKKLVEALNEEGLKTKFWRFPERSTAIGNLINSYLEQKCEVEDHAIHLLFTANRWEAVPEIKSLLLNGTTVIVDRYSFSGVAFSAAKKGMDLEWCKNPERGLPEPDAVIYLDLSSEEAANRAMFGGERYEKTEFQRRVAQNYRRLFTRDWKILDANQTVEDLHLQIKNIAKTTMEESQLKPLGELWAHKSPVQNGT